MTILTRLMRLPLPEFVKKRGLTELFELTADAFECEAPELRGLSFAECLSRYASFTRQQSECFLQSRQLADDLKHRLYHNSRVFGEKLRRVLRVSSWVDAVSVLETIYGLIEIDFCCDTQGEVTVQRCFFSNHYSAEVCGLISSLDEGLAAGLTGGRLRFSRRITEGCGCCKGFLSEGLRE